ncbi:MAG: DUF4386 domain-containing protein [Candidatus Omnitrophota bacterium]|nr:MAG: DUF4386 domain-containing protein [Candidatus Omnitrophota bacterium]
MSTNRKKSRLLGIAFLPQFITSFVSGMFIFDSLIVSGNITESMANISNNILKMRIGILLEIITAIGVVFLGAILFITLRKQSEKIALTAFGLYILEAGLSGVKALGAFSLMNISKEYALSSSSYLLTLGKTANEFFDFAMLLLLLTFCFGGFLFYYLLFKSKVIPRALSLWGLITIIPILIGVLLAFFGLQVPFYLYLPYLPFEFVVGVWIIITGINEEM